MTIWTPSLKSDSRRRYLAIVESLAESIRAGELSHGQRLPTHRALADRLGVAVNTVSRAYAEAQRRGLVDSGVGRGTFVRDGRDTGPGLDGSAQSWTTGIDPRVIDLGFNCPVLEPTHADSVARALRATAELAELSTLLAYHPPWRGLERHRRAGARWAASRGLAPDPGDVVLCSGAQHAGSVVLAAHTAPGDVVLTEELTDPGIKFLAATRNLRLVGVPIDEHGLVPDTLEAACRSGGAKALFCMPTHQSPTLAIMPEARRREIARIARAHGLTILENDVYGPYVADSPPPVATFAPERTFYLTSLSKSVAPGLRVGYVIAPGGSAERLLPGLAGTGWMASPIMAEVASILIEDGTAARLVARQRAEMAARNVLAAELLRGQHHVSLPTGLHVWLTLPAQWRAQHLVAQARARGIIVTPVDAFVVGSAHAPHAVRLSLGGATPSRAALRRGLTTVVDVLAGRPEASYLIM